MVTTMQGATRSTSRSLLESASAAVAAIWVSSAVVAVFAPDMVSGSQHEHLPIAAITVWVWTATATAYVLMAARRPTSAALVGGVTAIWASVAVAALAAPLMVTGSDPTQIPMAAILAPVVGAIATGFLALHAATTG